MLLENEALPRETEEGLHKIYHAGDLLLGIINDILDLSKIEAGKLELVPTKYDVASLINDVVQLNMMRIGSKPIEFELHVDENTPAMVLGDALRVRQILNNLLSNAFKYTAKGVVKLSVSVVTGIDQKGSLLTLVFNVSDTGQGMTEEQISQLFDEYSRFNLEANRTTEGTGLGMSITRNLVRMMNGEISVVSEPGEGSVFTLRLPQGIIDSEVLGKELADNLRQFRMNGTAQMKRAQITREPMPYGSVLVVDDVETNIYVAKGLMMPYGLKFDSADSGFAAIDKIKQGKVYDIVFMDHMMPKMDGIEATKIIRGLGYAHPIVALTANAVAGQADVFLANGFDGFISKPIDLRQLNAALNKLIRDKQPHEVIEATHLQACDSSNNADAKAEHPQLDPQLAASFARDADRSLVALEAAYANGANSTDESLHLYTINAHAMKSALANIGETGLSASAFRLEQAGRNRDRGVISAETPAFLDALRAVVKKITPQEEDEYSETRDDQEYLREKLLALHAMCAAFDIGAAENALAALKQKTWSRQTKNALNTITEHLLHSDLDEAADIAKNYADGIHAG
jgi:CheY-like chemotaxis protein/two-component sensor histidine kinase/HPt (histidine-containing phosphotransfer) domain-containing protein